MTRSVLHANKSGVTTLLLLVLAPVSFAAAEDPRPVQRMSFGPPISLLRLQHVPGLVLPPIEKVFHTTNLRVHSEEQLQQIATAQIRIGMRSDEVSQILEENSIDAMRITTSGPSMTSFYGSGQLSDPVLVVQFRRDVERSVALHNGTPEIDTIDADERRNRPTWVLGITSKTNLRHFEVRLVRCTLARQPGCVCCWSAAMDIVKQRRALSCGK